MNMDFSGADRQNDFSTLIPQGTLAFGVLKIRPHNLDAGLWETPSKSSDARYLDCEINIVGGQHNARKVWTRIGTAGSEKYINMGKAQIRAILEVGKQASEQNIAGYAIGGYQELNGLQVAIKVKEEPEQNGYPAKNDVAVFLSPVDPVTQKDFERLVAGDTEPKGKQNIRSGSGGGGNAAAAAPAARWAAGAAQATPAPAAAVSLAEPPAWLGQQNPTPQDQPASQPAAGSPSDPVKPMTATKADDQSAEQCGHTPPWANL